MADLLTSQQGELVLLGKGLLEVQLVTEVVSIRGLSLGVEDVAVGD